MSPWAPCKFNVEPLSIASRPEIGELLPDVLPPQSHGVGYNLGLGLFEGFTTRWEFRLAPFRGNYRGTGSLSPN